MTRRFSMAQYTQNAGLSCIADWRWSESQNDAPSAAGTGPARSGGPVCAVEYAKVTECVTFALRSHVMTGGPALSSPVMPVRGFRIELGGDDEHTLRQRLRMRAMAMADRLTPPMDEQAVGGYETSPARNAGSQHGSPGPSSVSSLNADTIPSQQSGAPTAMSLAGHGSLRVLTEPLCDGALRQQLSPHAASSEYVLNRIIRGIEAGVHPTEHMNGGCRGRGSSEGHPPRPCPGEKSTDRWGETETEWLCWYRNEVKALMGKEAYGRARLKAGFWKYVEERMRAKAYNRADDQCKNKFNQILDYYRRLKAHESWSGLPSYCDMNQTRRKKYNVDFVLRRRWYNIIHPVENDKDSINLSNLMDSGADKEHLEDGEGVNDIDGEMDGGGEDPAAGSGGSVGGSRSTGFEPTLGRRKRTASNAHESGVQAMTVAMRAHTTTLTRSDLAIAKMRCEATRDIAKQQVEVHHELVQQDIASRERIANIMGDKVEKGYFVLADAIRTLRPRTDSPYGDPDSNEFRSPFVLQLVWAVFI
ncbi:hypothetical protein CBR_g54150 [Chara braunii]|uniref:Myb/SANT-like DNA-binding domain-containing protein n=1 Tax=Chara braunii TaxID=69332 RepID=A0A388MBU4_CHABU|nr:hypothetical protein CBR_g54150 [Chara braunii]|eukprot:GBG92030.1 hypothetical protein CBR_g54150 [Chara braunii]